MNSFFCYDIKRIVHTRSSKFGENVSLTLLFTLETDNSGHYCSNQRFVSDSCKFFIRCKGSRLIASSLIRTENTRRRDYCRPSSTEQDKLCCNSRTFSELWPICSRNDATGKAASRRHSCCRRSDQFSPAHVLSELWVAQKRLPVWNLSLILNSMHTRLMVIFARTSSRRSPPLNMW